MKNLKLVIAGLIIVFALKDDIRALIPNVIPHIIPVQVISVELSKPDQEFIDFSKDFVSEITVKEELAELAVLNDEYAQKLVLYKDVKNSVHLPSAEDALTIYTLVGKEVFATKYMGKYPKYKEGVSAIMKDVSGAKNKTLGPDDLQRLSNLFRGLSWNLVEKLKSG